MNNHRVELPEAYVDAQLDVFARELEHGPYPRYPAETERLISLVEELGRTAAGAVILPGGNWLIPPRFDKHTDISQPSEIDIDGLKRAGYELDSQGRPLHPWFKKMIETPELGVLGGKGFFWAWGPNRTADSVVIRGDSILLIERGDTGSWALPGGFIDGGEHAANAAKREVKEETGINLEKTWGIPFYKGPVADVRMTAHAWPETTAFLYQLDSDDTQEPVGHDDAQSAAWVPLAELARLKLYGSHSFLAQLALSQLDAVSGQARAARLAIDPIANAY